MASRRAVDPNCASAMTLTVTAGSDVCRLQKAWVAHLQVDGCQTPVGPWARIGNVQMVPPGCTVKHAKSSAYSYLSFNSLSNYA